MGNKTYQGSISLIKIKDGESGTSYYTHIQYATDASGSNMSSSPTGKAYIGVYSGTEQIAPLTPESYVWSKFVGSDGVSIIEVRELYWLKTNNDNVTQITQSNQITDTDRQNGWTSIIPTYITNGIYYTCIETTLSNGQLVWSAPTINHGLTDTNSNAKEAIDITHGINQYFWYLGTDYTTGIPAGTYITQISQDDFKTSPTGNVNLLLQASSINLREGTTTHAQLNTSGLKILKGGLEAGSINTDDYIYIWSIDDSIGHTLNINSSGNKSDWRIVVGKKFGIDKAGNVYASNAKITGSITATAGTIGNWKIESPTNNTFGGALYTNGYSFGNGVLVSPGYTPNNTSKVGLLPKGKTWAFTAGDKFGVTTTGELYASGINLTELVLTGDEIKSDSTHYAKVSNEGLVVSSGGQVAKFGSDITLGSTRGSNVYIDSSSINMKDGSKTMVSVDGDGLKIYSKVVDDNSAVVTMESDQTTFYENQTEIGRISYNTYNSQRYFRFMEEYNQKIYAGLVNYSGNGESTVELFSNYGYIGNVNKAEVLLTTNDDYSPIFEVNLYGNGGSDFPSRTGNMYLTSSGYLYASGGGNVSDKKRKENIKKIDFAKDVIMGLRPVTFQWKNSSHTRTHMGFIAQEVAELGGLLGKNLSVYDARYKDHSEYHGEEVEDSELDWSLFYSEFIPPMVQVIQDQQKEIEQLKKDIQELKNK